MKPQSVLHRHLAALAIATFSLASTAQAQPRDAVGIINQTCVACHASNGQQGWSRISEQRKTPEGWLMTIARMQNAHGLQISDEDRRTVVKYLADKQGLAPSESEPGRYALERRLNTVEKIGDQRYTEMCARCHSAARPALQRRAEPEWRHLVHQHLGQWPSLEYQQFGRDREWLKIALEEMVPYMAKNYPMDSTAWSQWTQNLPASTSFAGGWSFSGHMTGKGALRGNMQVKSLGQDRFDVQVQGQFADGSPFNGKGQALVYTGHEWRASLDINGTPMRQVFSVQDGRMKGRMFETAHDERGLDFDAAREDGPATVLAVQPAHLRQGSEATLTIVGAKLQGQPDFGPGVKVLSVEGNGSRMQVKVRVEAQAPTGLRTASVGSAPGYSVAVYDRVQQVKVIPSYAVARIGGNGGSRPKIQGRFDAEAWGKNAQGQEFRIGLMPANWSVQPFNAVAKEERDLQFAGQMDARHGVFTPGNAGPNPKRNMGTNNAGNLQVTATVKDGKQTVQGEGQLIVTVQTWINAPIP